jgi:hypothetical protein
MDLIKMRAEIEKFYHDTALPGEQLPQPKKSDAFIIGIQKNQIYFMDGKNTYVQYDALEQVDFNGPEIKNQEWRAQLCRFGWMRSCAEAYLQTGDEIYVKAMRDTVEAWLRFRPTKPDDEIDRSYYLFDSTLSTGIRLMAWWNSIPYCADSPYIDKDFLDRVYTSTLAQLKWLEKHNAKKGNFKVFELKSMLFLGCVLPGCEGVLPYVSRTIGEAFRMQVEEDGSHEEHTMGYHNAMREDFTHFAIMAQNRPSLGIQIDGKRLAKMYEYSLAAMAPDGRRWGIGDDSRWHLDVQPTDRAEFLARYQKLRAFLQLPPLTGELESKFPCAGQYFFQDEKTKICLDATHFGGSHFHPARGAITCYHGDAMLLIDPGSLNYERTDPFCMAGRSTPLHNTIVINGFSQCHGNDARIAWVDENENVAAFQCVYDGGYTNYRPGRSPWDTLATAKSICGKHVRTFVWIKGKFGFCVDYVEAFAPSYHVASHYQLLNCPYHFDKEIKTIFTCRDTYNLHITSPWSSFKTEAVLYEGDQEQMLGFIAAGVGGLTGGTPAPLFSIEGNVKGATTQCCILTPFEGKDVPTVQVKTQSIDMSLHFEVKWRGETYLIAASVPFLQDDAYHTSVGYKGPLVADGPLAILGDDLSYGYHITYVQRKEDEKK